MKITIEYKNDVISIEAHNDMAANEIIELLEMSLAAYKQTLGGWDA